MLPQLPIHRRITSRIEGRNRLRNAGEHVARAEGSLTALESGGLTAGAAGDIFRPECRARTRGLQDGADAEGWQSNKSHTEGPGSAAAATAAAAAAPALPDFFPAVGE